MKIPISFTYSSTAAPSLSIIIYLVYLVIGCNAKIAYLLHNVLQFAFNFVLFVLCLLGFSAPSIKTVKIHLRSVASPVFRVNSFLYLECC